jgi:hypothetical protein
VVFAIPRQVVMPARRAMPTTLLQDAHEHPTSVSEDSTILPRRTRSKHTSYRPGNLMMHSTRQFRSHPNTLPDNEQLKLNSLTINAAGLAASSPRLETRPHCPSSPHRQKSWRISEHGALWRVPPNSIVRSSRFGFPESALDLAR